MIFLGQDGSLRGELLPVPLPGYVTAYIYNISNLFASLVI